MDFLRERLGHNFLIINSEVTIEVYKKEATVPKFGICEDIAGRTRDDDQQVGEE